MMNDLPAQSYIIGFYLHVLNLDELPFLAVICFEDLGLTI
jgi:hypothetical protein